jgi:hypothetical protein
LKKTDISNKVSTPHISNRKAKLIGATGQKRNEQKEFVTLHPVLSNGEAASKKFKHVP